MNKKQLDYSLKRYMVLILFIVLVGVVSSSTYIAPTYLKTNNIQVDSGTVLTLSNNTIFADAVNVTGVATFNDVVNANSGIVTNNITLDSLQFSTTIVEIGSANTDSSGTYSIAIGDGTTSDGIYSVAMGTYAEATGGSVALGRQAKSNTTQTIAIGFNSYAIGEYSIALGSSTGMAPNTRASASGDYAIAIGHSTISSGENSVCLGRSCYADESKAMSLGYNAGSQGVGAISIGHSTWAEGANAIALGSGTENLISNSFKVGGDMTDVFLDTNLEVSGSTNLSSSSNWIYTGNGGGIYWNSTHTCMVGPDGNVATANCDSD